MVLPGDGPERFPTGNGKKIKEKEDIAFVNKSRRYDHIQRGGGEVTVCSLSLIRVDLNAQITEEEKTHASSI